MNRNCMNQNMSGNSGRMMRQGQYGMRTGACREREMTSACPQRQEREMTSACPQRREREDRTWMEDIPTGNRRQLRSYIDEVSFAVYEALLFLDTHPEDQEALQFFREHNRKRSHALKIYAQMYGPLTISTANETACGSWEWMNQPWPWEGGDC